MARDDDPILGPRKDQLGGPGPRTRTINADEWNRLVDKVFALEEGLDGIGASASGELLYDMPIATASVGTPVRYRSSADSGTPTGTPATSLVAWESYPSGQALRLAATGLAGGLVWPINHGLTLPAEYVLEVDFAGMDIGAAGNICVVMPFCDFFQNGGVDTVRGFALEHYRDLAQIDRRTIDLVSGPYTRVLGSGIGDSLQWTATPDYPAGVHSARFRVNRAGGFTPARWLVRTEHRGGAASGAPGLWSMSGADSPQTQLDALTFDDIGIGVFGSSGAMNVDIARLRIIAP